MGPYLWYPVHQSFGHGEGNSWTSHRSRGQRVLAAPVCRAAQLAHPGRLPSLILTVKKDVIDRDARCMHLTGTHDRLADSADSMRISRVNVDIC
jgi:hypothetical protein